MPRVDAEISTGAEGSVDGATHAFDQCLDIEVGFASERGRRERNEDYVGAYLGDAYERGRRGVAMVVADGVEGTVGAREAAELTVRGFLDGYYGLPETLGVERAAGRALDAVNRWISSQGRTDPNLAHMASTCSALVLRGRSAHVVHVGDSRVYRLRGGRLTRLTTDHTLSQPDVRPLGDIDPMRPHGSTRRSLERWRSIHGPDSVMRWSSPTSWNKAGREGAVRFDHRGLSTTATRLWCGRGSARC